VDGERRGKDRKKYIGKALSIWWLNKIMPFCVIKCSVVFIEFSKRTSSRITPTCPKNK
jgi:hypothetical protein